MAEAPSPALPLTKAVVVIGAGTMGSGIAEVAAAAGHRVYLRDTSPASLDKGLAQIRRSLDKRVARARLTPAEDQKEGMNAFLEKRPPAYQGR